MGRKGNRVRIAPCIYRDGSGLSATVNVGRTVTEKRFPADGIEDARDWQAATRLQLRRQRGTATERGTLRHDAERYLRLMTHLVGFASRRAEIRAWLALHGTTRRDKITPQHVQAARVSWRRDGVAPKTINHRVASLRHLYRTLDGKRAYSPCDDIAALAVLKTPPVVVPPTVIRRVAMNMRAAEAAGTLRSAKTRARYMGLASTGKRPSELRRAQPADVDLERRVWNVRDGKGGWGPGVYLNDDMMTAWRLFVKADAWGVFDINSFSRVLRSAGWPRGVRAYNLRYVVGISLSESGADLSDVQAHRGHRRISTTREHYVPVLGSRMQAISEQIDGRLQWDDEPIMAPDHGTVRK